MAQKKACPSDKIVNPATGRCVNKTGKIGKALLEKAKAQAQPNPKPKSVSLVHEYTFMMNVDSKLDYAPGMTRDNYVAKIIEWYESWLKGGYEKYVFDDSRIKSGSVAVMPSGLFKVTYKTTIPISKEEMIEYNEWLADPDDDGNHPIKYHNKTYLVSGQVQ